MKVREPLPDAAQDAAVTDRDDDGVGRLPAELLGDLKRHGLLPLNRVGVVAGVAVVPPEAVAGLDAEGEGLGIAAANGRARRRRRSGAAPPWPRGAVSGTKMWHGSPRAAERHASDAPALPVEAVANSPRPSSRPLSSTMELARSLSDAEGLAVSSLTHSRCRPRAFRRPGTGQRGVAPTLKGNSTPVGGQWQQRQIAPVIAERRGGQVRASQ